MRIQLGQGSAAQVTSTMLKNEGVAAFYNVFFFASLPMFFYVVSFWVWVWFQCGMLVVLLVLVWPDGVCVVFVSLTWL